MEISQNQSNLDPSGSEGQTESSVTLSPPQPNGLLIIAYAVVITVTLTGALFLPWVYLTTFPPEPPKSASQLLTEQLAQKGIAFDAEAFTRGETLFNTNCTACHAPKGGAKPHLGKDMVHSTFTASQTDKALMTFLKLGRPPGDPLNTTGVGMPPKGGNPALTDDNLKDLIAYIRGLQVTEGIEFK